MEDKKRICPLCLYPLTYSKNCWDLLFLKHNSSSVSTSLPSSTKVLIFIWRFPRTLAPYASDEADSTPGPLRPGQASHRVPSLLATGIVSGSVQKSKTSEDQ